MANPVALLYAMQKLDQKYGYGEWGELASDHPDILWLRSLNPYASEKVKKQKIERQNNWSDEKDNYIKENYTTSTDSEIASALQTSASKVRRRRLELGLKSYHNAHKATPVIAVDSEGNVTARYRAIGEAAEQLGVTRYKVGRAIKNKTTVNGMILHLDKQQ